MVLEYAKYYTFSGQSDKLTAECNICKSKIKYTTKSKYNLEQHLKVSHKKEYHEAVESEQKQSKQSKIVLTGSKLKTTAPPFTKQEKITESVIDNLIGRDGLPVTLTTKKWFIDFMADVEVRYSCPTYSNIIQ